MKWLQYSKTKKNSPGVKRDSHQKQAKQKFKDATPIWTHTWCVRATQLTSCNVTAASLFYSPYPLPFSDWDLNSTTSIAISFGLGFKAMAFLHVFWPTLPFEYWLQNSPVDCVHPQSTLQLSGDTQISSCSKMQICFSPGDYLPDIIAQTHGINNYETQFKDKNSNTEKHV